MRTRITYLLFLLLSALSCAKVQTSSLAVSVVAEVENGARPVKGVVGGDRFAHGNTFGLFVYYAENEGSQMQNFRSYGSKYANIKAMNENGRWSYTLNGSSSSSESFFLIEPSAEGASALAICAYAPCLTGAVSITDIPFTLGGQYSKISDLMWASQNLNSDNLYIEPKGNTETVHLTFRHALSMLNIRLKCKYDNTTMQVSSVKIVRKGETPLYASGRFNAVTGTFYDSVPADEVVFSFENDGGSYVFDDSEYLDLPVMILPVDEYIADGDYEIVFTFNGHTLSDRYPIKRDDVKVGEVCGFEQGKVYTFEFLFNNYAQIQNVEIDLSETWPVSTEDLEF